MSILEFLDRLEADPFDPALIRLFDEAAAESAENAKSTQEVQDELS